MFGDIITDLLDKISNFVKINCWRKKTNTWNKYFLKQNYMDLIIISTFWNIF